MTKRPSPFETGICRQSKIHINNYENDIIAQKNLEDRTLKRLMEGSKKLHSIILINDDRQHGDFKRNQTQKCITNYLTLNGKKSLENVRKTTTPLDTSNRCSFCDARSLTYQCGLCLEFYCSSCSFANYESFEDSRICLSCS